METSLTVLYSGFGVGGQYKVARTKDGATPRTTALPAALALSSFVKTDANTGAGDLPAGHGLTTGNKVNVFWIDAAGERRSRYGMDATVVTNAVTVDGGAGDDLPASATAGMLIARQVEVTLPIVGDNMAMLVIHPTVRAHVDLQSGAGASHKAMDLAGGEGFCWASGTGVDNPIAGDTVAKAMASAGEATAGVLTIGVLEDTTP